MTPFDEIRRMEKAIATLTAERDEWKTIAQSYEGCLPGIALKKEREKVRELREALLAFRDCSRKVSLHDLAAGHQGLSVQAYHNAKKAMIDLAQLKEQDDPALSCPGCGDPTEIDREVPPNPYYCEKCEG